MNIFDQLCYGQNLRGLLPVVFKIHASPSRFPAELSLHHLIKAKILIFSLLSLL